MREPLFKAFQFNQMRATLRYSLADGATEGFQIVGSSMVDAEGQRCMFEVDLLWRAPTDFKFGQGGLRQVVKNSAARVVDRNNDHIAPGEQRQATEVVLAG